MVELEEELRLERGLEQEPDKRLGKRPEHKQENKMGRQRMLEQPRQLKI